jgi:hypothetical protein
MNIPQLKVNTESFTCKVTQNYIPFICKIISILFNEHVVSILDEWNISIRIGDIILILETELLKKNVSQ